MSGAKRGQVVRQRRRAAAKPNLQPPHLADPSLDPEYIGKQTYLTVPQLMAYGQFQTKKATYCFLAAHPEIRRGYRRIFRRDVDLVLQSRGGARHAS